jgi:hypothetical protein
LLLPPLANPGDNPGMDDKATKRGGGAVAIVLVAVLVLLPMLYVLSVGPVAWMITGGRIDPSWKPAVDVAYTPLEWVAEHVPVVGPAIQGYVELWVPVMQPIYTSPPAATIPAPATAPLSPLSGA